MSLVSKMKDFFSTEDKKMKDIETIQEAMEMINKLKSGQYRDACASSAVNKILDQLINWVDVLKTDMDIVKGDKLRSILADLTGIKNQLGTMAGDISELQISSVKDCCTSKKAEDIIIKVDKITKSKKSTTNKEI